jgi:hypothetical protein
VGRGLRGAGAGHSPDSGIRAQQQTGRRRRLLVVPMTRPRLLTGELLEYTRGKNVMRLCDGVKAGEVEDVGPGAPAYMV